VPGSRCLDEALGPHFPRFFTINNAIDAVIGDYGDYRELQH